MSEAIQRRILADNRTYFAAISLFRSRLLSRATEIILNKTVIRPVVTCGAEVWTLTKKEEQAVLILKGKYLEKIYGPKCKKGEQEKSDESRTRTDEQRRIYSKMDNPVKSPREYGGGQDAQKDLHSRTGRDEKKGMIQEKMERGSRKRSSRDGSEKMERVGGRQEKIGRAFFDRSKLTVSCSANGIIIIMIIIIIYCYSYRCLFKFL